VGNSAFLLHAHVHHIKEHRHFYTPYKFIAVTQINESTFNPFINDFIKFNHSETVDSLRAELTEQKITVVNHTRLLQDLQIATQKIQDPPSFWQKHKATIGLALAVGGVMLISIIMGLVAWRYGLLKKLWPTIPEEHEEIQMEVQAKTTSEKRSEERQSEASMTAIKGLQDQITMLEDRVKSLEILCE
jgi:hypothetical protein